MIKILYTLCICLTVSLAHPDRPGQYLPHDGTIVDCAKYSRSENQHSCLLLPFTTEGPYFLTSDLKRSDITDGQEGMSLDLTIQLTDAADCSPLPGLFVHVWQANAYGHYSGVNESFPGPLLRTTFRQTPINDERWLRGYQITDDDGKVSFKSIVPGWYFGRNLHVHVEVYSQDTTDGNSIAHIGQLYFARDLPVRLSLIEPYSSNQNQIIFNEQDEWFVKDNGTQTILDLKLTPWGLKSQINVAIDPKAKHHFS